MENITVNTQHDSRGYLVMLPGKLSVLITERDGRPAVHIATAADTDPLFVTVDSDYVVNRRAA